MLVTFFSWFVTDFWGGERHYYIFHRIKNQVRRQTFHLKNVTNIWKHSVLFSETNRKVVADRVAVRAVPRPGVEVDRAAGHVADDRLRQNGDDQTAAKIGDLPIDANRQKRLMALKECGKWSFCFVTVGFQMLVTFFEVIFAWMKSPPTHKSG